MSTTKILQKFTKVLSDHLNLNRFVHMSAAHYTRPLSKHEIDYSFVRLDTKEQRSKMQSLCEKAGIHPRIGFIGGGNMAQALIKGFISSGLVNPSNIGVCEPNSTTLHKLKEMEVLCSTESDRILAQFNDGLVFLAVKPNVLQEAVQMNKDVLSNGKGLIVSIIAGATIENIKELLSPLDLPIVRVMPNTGALVSASASVFAVGESCTAEHAEIIQMLMETVGTCHQIPESQIDAACGLSGSGPAFVYTVLDALSDSGVMAGLPRDLSTHLAAQTVMGAAKALLDTGMHPGELKNRVCSPGGTTIAGIQALEEAGIRSTIMKAVEASVAKARELGEE